MEKYVSLKLVKLIICIYVKLRFGLVNSIGAYLSLKVFIMSRKIKPLMSMNWIHHTKSKSNFDIIQKYLKKFFKTYFGT